MRFIGIEKTNDKILFSFIKKKGNNFLLEKQNIIQNTPHNVKQLYKEINKKNAIVITGLDLQDCIIKFLSLPITKKSHLKKAIAFQEESISSLDKNDTIILTKETNNSFDITFFITTKKALLSHLKDYNFISVDSDIISTKASCLTAFANWYAKNSKDKYVIHFGFDSIYCIYIKDNTIQKAHIINIGSNTLTYCIPNENTSSIDLTKITKKQSTSLYLSLEKLKNELHKIFLSFQRETKEKLPLLITGNTSVFR